MGVEQERKKKVRPVLEFSKELNEFVTSHTGGDFIDICNDQLREWRQVEGDCEIVDLKSAYLQICVSPELWKYQLVKFKGKVYAFTRLGFGLNSAPKMMSKILKTVLAKKPEVSQATSSYIDDIIVDGC
ncbi:Gag-Pro-Pol polyprotein [Elysia marginata]|uniref:Gag-Pro-Pol polyprotein n=1 Tax=Elysia marginata TaxID=1093978 RepID=A0AAV4ISR4_9GAST|nr:Gag-Pro-Pol polyprotein [Elysia marginata]